MEKLNGRVLHSGGKHGFGDSVSGSWKNRTGEYRTRVESTVFEIS